MARKRAISPALWENEEALGLTDAAFRVWIGLWSVCDRNGVFEWRPRKWAFRFAPKSQADPDQLFQELIDARFVARYEAEGEPYGFCIKWAKHQDPHPSEAPQYPMPADDPRFIPYPPRCVTKPNAKWAFEVYGLTPTRASTDASTGASTDTDTDTSTSTRPASPSRPSQKIKRSPFQGSEIEGSEPVPPPEPAPGLDFSQDHPREVSPIGHLDEPLPILTANGWH